jgi:hypothetical protein
MPQQQHEAEADKKKSIREGESSERDGKRKESEGVAMSRQGHSTVMKEGALQTADEMQY